MKLLTAILLLTLLPSTTSCQMIGVRNRRVFASTSAPAYVTQCSGGNSASGNSASCPVSITTGNTIVVGSYNFIAADPPVITATTGTVTHLSCAVYSSFVFCLDVITGATGASDTVAATATTGSFLSLLVQVGSSGTVDGGTASCNGTTGCSMTGGTVLSTTVTGANVVLTSNDLVFVFVPVANGSETLTAASTPIAMTMGANLAANVRGFYGSASAGTTHATATGTQSGSFPWAFGTVALHP